jgi:hypothetical protein
MLSRGETIGVGLLRSGLARYTPDSPIHPLPRKAAGRAWRPFATSHRHGSTQGRHLRTGQSGRVDREVGSSPTPHFSWQDPVACQLFIAYFAVGN